MTPEDKDVPIFASRSNGESIEELFEIKIGGARIGRLMHYHEAELVRGFLEGAWPDIVREFATPQA